MKTLAKLGRFIYAIPFLLFGIFHFMQAEKMSGMLEGWPIPEAFIYFSGLALLLAAVSIILNYKARLACLLLALMLLLIIVGIHIPAMAGGDEAAMPAILKDLGLLGAALSYSGILKK